MNPESSQNRTVVMWIVLIVVVLIVVVFGGLLYTKQNKMGTAVPLATSPSADAQRISLIKERGLVLGPNPTFGTTTEYSFTSNGVNYDITKISYWTSLSVPVLTATYKQYFAINNYKQLGELNKDATERIVVKQGDVSVTVTLAPDFSHIATTTKTYVQGTKVDVSVSVPTQK